MSVSYLPLGRKHCWVPSVFQGRIKGECAREVMAVQVEWDIPFCSLMRCVQVLSAPHKAVLKLNLLPLLESCRRVGMEREECVAV